MTTAEREHLTDPMPLREVLAELAAALGRDWRPGRD